MCLNFLAQANVEEGFVDGLTTGCKKIVIESYFYFRLLLWYRVLFRILGVLQLTGTTQGYY